MVFRALFPLGVIKEKFVWIFRRQRRRAPTIRASSSFYSHAMPFPLISPNLYFITKYLHQRCCRYGQLRELPTRILLLQQQWRILLSARRKETQRHSMETIEKSFFGEEMKRSHTLQLVSHFSAFCIAQFLPSNFMPNASYE